MLQFASCPTWFLREGVVLYWTIGIVSEEVKDLIDRLINKGAAAVNYFLLAHPKEVFWCNFLCITRSYFAPYVHAVLFFDLF